MPTFLRSMARPRHWNAKPRAVRTWITNGREVCPYCCARPAICGAMIAGKPCGREPGHLGDHGACEGRLHCRHWKHQPKRRLP